MKKVYPVHWKNYQIVMIYVDVGRNFIGCACRRKTMKSSWKYSPRQVNIIIGLEHIKNYQKLIYIEHEKDITFFQLL